MINLFFDLGPSQQKITEDDIRGMIALKPRRMKISVEFADRYGLKSPFKDDADWAVWFPFKETFWNAFDAMTSYPNWGIKESKYNRFFTFLDGSSALVKPPEDVVQCCDVLGKYVAIRDCMAMSFALDYDHVNGNPALTHSEVGRLRDLAKPRDGSAPGPEKYRIGLEGLTKLSLQFLSDMTCFSSANAIVAMPSSKPDKPFCLARDLAAALSKQTGLPDLSEHVVTIKERPQLKGVVADDRLDTIMGTIAVAGGIFSGKVVLLVDDVYQSGVSINYVAMLLQQAGCSKIYGLTCDKTCSNTDNIG